MRNPVLETAINDVEGLRDSLQQSEEKLFDTGVYITIYADTMEELARLESKLVTMMEAKLIYLKPALFEQLEGLSSILPINDDKLQVYTPMNTSPISSFFPFVSEDLSSNQGIMYGINLHNNNLVIFDRFSLENANEVVFAKSGSGKSYTTKLEIIRSLMAGIDMVIVIDPENEYDRLAETFGGSMFNISLSSHEHINPFDIPPIPEGETPSDVLRSHIVNLASLLKLMLGKLTPEEDALLDRAITETYASREIVADTDFTGKEPPLLGDLETVLRNLEGGKDMAEKLYKYTKGSFAGFLNQPTNIDVNNRLIVFSIRDLEEELRPIGMFVVLNFIWNLIRAKLAKRLLFIDEAWIMMKNDDSATFLFGLVKRARKYYLGVSTITQDVEDFLRSPYGRPIVTNSSLQLLLKQAPATIDIVAKAFDLTDAEKNFLARRRGRHRHLLRRQAPRRHPDRAVVFRRPDHHHESRTATRGEKTGLTLFRYGRKTGSKNIHIGGGTCRDVFARPGCDRSYSFCGGSYRCRRGAIAALLSHEAYQWGHVWGRLDT